MQSVAQLAGLVNKSWLHREISGRYHIHELLRQYGAEQLTIHSDEEIADSKKPCPLLFRVPIEGSQEHIRLTEIDLEMDNLRVAWEWHLTSQQIDSIAAFVESLWNYYQRKGWFQEAVFHAGTGIQLG